MPIGVKSKSKGFEMWRKVGAIDFHVLTLEDLEEKIKAGEIDRGVVDANEFMGRIVFLLNFFGLLYRHGTLIGIYHDIVRCGEDERTMLRDMDHWRNAVHMAFISGILLVLEAESHDAEYIPRTIEDLIARLQYLREHGDFSDFGFYYRMTPEERFEWTLRSQTPSHMIPPKKPEKTPKTIKRVRV